VKGLVDGGFLMALESPHLMVDHFGSKEIGQGHVTSKTINAPSNWRKVTFQTNQDQNLCGHQRLAGFVK